eukprot:TRINITY_DN20534_c0_g2_i1.p1 TRINITY_DN20534_c0_g2~~TRINITY_DN20534_c0_g2_i1.p1  ORF type:complete len:764 (-),score=172.59 TRINITY_DN20534_c0_g2_i1:134-2425(-)
MPPELIPPEPAPPDVTPPEVTTPQPTQPPESDIDKLTQKLARTENDLQELKKENGSLRRKLKYAVASKEKLREKHKNRVDVIVKEKDKVVQKFIDGLPVVPAALFRILIQKKKKVKWENHKEAMKLCLAVYFRSTSAYNVLRSSGFQLPHPRTLRRQFSTVLSQVGFCSNLLEMVRLRTLALEEHEKHVTLSLDGMALTKSITYDKHKDKLVGFVNCGEYRKTTDIADQGVVVMIRGLTLKWKQVLGYFVTKHNLAGPTLQSIIADAVKSVTGVGLFVDAIVMDQESTQWRWIKDMGVSVDRPFTFHDGVQSFVIPDPPHLIKSLRNNFMSKDIKFTINDVEMTAKWCHLEQLFSIDNAHKLHAAPKLKGHHFSLPRGKKMKVILACQIFSHSVAAALRLFVKESLMPPESLHTAAFVEKVNMMWDFVDSHSLSDPPGKKPVTRSSFQSDQQRFSDFASFVASWKFVKNGKEKKIPSHQGWQLALSAMRQLTHKLIIDKEIMTYLCLRKCNQDHVENLHSMIRGYNGFDDHPTLPAYTNALRCLSCRFSTTELLDKTISAGANCLPDNEAGGVLHEAGGVAHVPSQTLESASIENESACSQLEISHADSPRVDSTLKPAEGDIVAYIAGSMIKKLNITGCSQCAGKLTTAPQTSPSLTTLKEFKPGALIHITKELFNLCSLFETHYRESTVKGLPLSNPKTTILRSFTTLQHSLTTPLTCACVHTLLESYCITRLFHDVRQINQKLKSQKRGSELNKDKKLNF